VLRNIPWWYQHCLAPPRRHNGLPTQCTSIVVFSPPYKFSLQWINFTKKCTTTWPPATYTFRHIWNRWYETIPDAAWRRFEILSCFMKITNLPSKSEDIIGNWHWRPWRKGERETWERRDEKNLRGRPRGSSLCEIHEYGDFYENLSFL